MSISESEEKEKRMIKNLPDNYKSMKINELIYLVERLDEYKKHLLDASKLDKAMNKMQAEKIMSLEQSERIYIARKDDEINKIKNEYEQEIQNLKENYAHDSVIREEYEETIDRLNKDIVKLNSKLEDHKEASMVTNSTPSNTYSKKEIDEIINSLKAMPLTGARISSLTPDVLKLNTSLISFSGKPNENIDDWIYKTNNMLMASNILDPIIKVKTIIPALNDTALHAYQAYEKLNPDMTWNTFSTFMKNKYKPANHQEKIRAKLLKLKQIDKLDIYINEFLILINQADKIEEIDKKVYFMNGLNQRTKGYLELQNPISRMKQLKNGK